MDEALKRIAQQLAARAPKSRIDPLLPSIAPPPAPAAEDMAITHLSKGSSQPAPGAEPAPEAEAPRQERPEPAGDIYQKISTGGREFSLDELGGEAGAEVVDPLMGPVLKPASSYRDVSLDELDVNITPEGPQPRS